MNHYDVSSASTIDHAARSFPLWGSRRHTGPYWRDKYIHSYILAVFVLTDEVS